MMESNLSNSELCCPVDSMFLYMLNASFWQRFVVAIVCKSHDSNYAFLFFLYPFFGLPWMLHVLNPRANFICLESFSWWKLRSNLQGILILRHLNHNPLAKVWLYLVGRIILWAYFAFYGKHIHQSFMIGPIISVLASQFCLFCLDLPLALAIFVTRNALTPCDLTDLYVAILTQKAAVFLILAMLRVIMWLLSSDAFRHYYGLHWSTRTSFTIAFTHCQVHRSIMVTSPTVPFNPFWLPFEAWWVGWGQHLVV